MTSTRTATTPPEPLPAGVYAARDLQWLGRAYARLDATDLAGGPEQPTCTLAALQDTVPQEQTRAPDPDYKPPSVSEMLARRADTKATCAVIEARLDRVHARTPDGPTWERVLRAVYVQRRDVDDVHTVCVEVATTCAPITVCTKWERTRRGELSVRGMGQAQRWTRDVLERAVAAYDEEVDRGC